MNVLLIEDPKPNLAVWYSAQSHLSFIQNCGEKINVIVREKYLFDLDKYWITNFKPDNVISAKGTFDLISILRKRRDEKYFCLSWKEVLLVHSILIFSRPDIYYWVQGILPEEDYVRTKNPIRKYSFKFLEKWALKSSDKLILVSNYMKEYMEKTRRLKFKDYVIIPCTSNLDYNQTKKIKNSFTYIGGLLEWQRLDRILVMFKNIVSQWSDSTLHLITYDPDKATELVEKYIPCEYHKNVVSKTLNDRNQIAAHLSSMEYGFLIRDDGPVNNVSSPIKLAEYLSCGVNVIISKSVVSFTNAIEEKGCGIIIEEDADINQLFSHQPKEQAAIELYNEIFNKEVILKKYQNLFSKN